MERNPCPVDTFAQEAERILAAKTQESGTGNVDMSHYSKNRSKQIDKSESDSYIQAINCIVYKLSQVESDGTSQLLVR